MNNVDHNDKTEIRVLMMEGKRLGCEDEDFWLLVVWMAAGLESSVKKQEKFEFSRQKLYISYFRELNFRAKTFNFIYSIEAWILAPKFLSNIIFKSMNFRAQIYIFRKKPWIMALIFFLCFINHTKILKREINWLSKVWIFALNS